MPVFRFSATTNECADDTYARLLTSVAHSQLRRFNVPDQYHDDRAQDCVLYFWERDLRRSFDPAAKTRFSTYVTTCVMRYLLPQKLAAYKTLDPVAYAAHLREQKAETVALATVDALTLRYGPAVIECIAAHARRRVPKHLAAYPGATRQKVIQTFIKTIRDTYHEPDPQEETRPG